MKPKTDILLTYNEAVKQPEYARALLLKDAFPEKVRQMTGLKQLVIKGTKIKKLPAWLPELTQLTKIQFQDNYDKIISPATFKLLANLPALQELIIESGQLPAEVGILKGLTEYEGLGEEPYVLFARNGYGSLFLIQLNDEQPDNPLVYYLDEEDYEEQPRVLTRSLTKTLAELPGVKKAELAGGELQVKYDKDVIAWEMIQAIAAETKQLRLGDLLKDAMAV